MNILLNELINIKSEEYKDWTICLNEAIPEGQFSLEEGNERLLEHISWKKSADKKMVFRRLPKYCLQFIRLNGDRKTDKWLYLGAFENLGETTNKNGDEIYRLERIDKYNSFAERLVVLYKKKQGPKQAKIDISEIESIAVDSLLTDRFIMIEETFPGFNNVSLSFGKLKTIITNNWTNWKMLLTNANGIYVISDSNTGKLYVGSTYGKEGIWQRWSSYVATNGHGNDVELKKLIKKDSTYASKYFTFSLIETFTNIDDSSEYIIEREQYWKNVLNTRQGGNNRN